MSIWVDVSPGLAAGLLVVLGVICAMTVIKKRDVWSVRELLLLQLLSLLFSPYAWISDYAVCAGIGIYLFYGPANRWLRILYVTICLGSYYQSVVSVAYFPLIWFPLAMLLLLLLSKPDHAIQPATGLFEARSSL